MTTTTTRTLASTLPSLMGSVSLFMIMLVKQVRRTLVFHFRFYCNNGSAYTLSDSDDGKLDSETDKRQDRRHGADPS